MNNYCKYCGEKLENNPSICPKCNTKLFENEINTEEEKNKLKEYKKKENKYLIIIITLYALPYLSNFKYNNLTLTFYSILIYGMFYH